MTHSSPNQRKWDNPTRGAVTDVIIICNCVMGSSHTTDTVCGKPSKSHMSIDSILPKPSCCHHDNYMTSVQNSNSSSTWVLCGVFLVASPTLKHQEWKPLDITANTFCGGCECILVICSHFITQCLLTCPTRLQTLQTSTYKQTARLKWSEHERGENKHAAFTGLIQSTSSGVSTSAKAFLQCYVSVVTEKSGEQCIQRINQSPSGFQPIRTGDI